MVASDWSIGWLGGLRATGLDEFPLLIQMYVRGLFIQTGGHIFYGKTYKFNQSVNNSKNCNIYSNGHQQKIMFLKVINIFYVY